MIGSWLSPVGRRWQRGVCVIGDPVSSVRPEGSPQGQPVLPSVASVIGASGGRVTTLAVRVATERRGRSQLSRRPRIDATSTEIPLRRPEPGDPADPRHRTVPANLPRSLEELSR